MHAGSVGMESCEVASSAANYANRRPNGRRKTMRLQMMHRLFGLLVSIVICNAVWAQSTAQVSGTIKDQTGAVLPGAEVTVTQTETGLMRNTITDETGSYVLTNLPIGPYRFEAGLPGFRTHVQTGTVLPGNSNPLTNAVLGVGQTAHPIDGPADAD